MSKPMIHAESSARRFGGKAEDYIEIHDFLDSSKAVFPDNRHRALTHNSWFIFVVERVFGHTIDVRLNEGDPCGAFFHLQAPKFYLADPGFTMTCSRCGGASKDPRRTGGTKTVSVRDVAEQHVLEDFGGKFIPTPGDYLEGMEFQPWMNNAIEGAPTSHRRLAREPGKVRRRAVNLD